ncbi:MAG: DUF362 domain-containing protein [Halanaerobacter sp.]
MGKIYQAFGDDGYQLAYQLLEELELDLDRDMKVGLKPNLILAKESAHGATTDPDLTAGVIEYLKEQGIEEIVIMEGSWVGANTEEAFEECGYRSLAQEYDLELYNLKHDQTKDLVSEGFELSVCQAPLEVDYLINLPVLKAHCQTKITCALKNLKGCIPDSEKRRYHTLGLHEPIAHLNNVLRSDLTIVDGIIGDLTYEEGGNPVQMNRVLAGFDPVLIDTYVAQLLGLKLSAIPYLELAEELGVGRTDLKQEQVIKINQAQAVAKDLTRRKKVEKLREYIKAEQACSACVGSLLHALQRCQDENQLPPEAKIYIGQGWQELEKEGLGVGNCTREFSDFIPGCPPTAAQIREGLLDYWQDE